MPESSSVSVVNDARHWWEHLLHNQTALRLKGALLFRPSTVVISVPYHLEHHDRREPVAT